MEVRSPSRPSSLGGVTLSKQTIETIQQAAQTDNIGDGIIFVYPVDQVVRISTGERGYLALSYEGDIDMRQEVDVQMQAAD